MAEAHRSGRTPSARIGRRPAARTWAAPAIPRIAFEDANYPAYTMSAAAAMLGVQPAFLRGLGEAGLLDPARSDGGHRRYSRTDLEMAARAREVVDDGLSLAAACRIVLLEYELARVRAELAQARATTAARSTAAEPAPGVP